LVDNLSLRAALPADWEHAAGIIKREAFASICTYEFRLLRFTTTSFLRWTPTGGVNDSGAVECLPNPNKAVRYAFRYRCAHDVKIGWQMLKFDYYPLNQQAAQPDALNVFILDAAAANLSDEEYTKQVQTMGVPNRQVAAAPGFENATPLALNRWHEVIFILNPNGTVCFVDGKSFTVWANPRPEIKQIIPEKMVLVLQGACRFDNARVRVSNEQTDPDLYAQLRAYVGR
jgi:hypothetical protein